MADLGVTQSRVVIRYANDDIIMWHHRLLLRRLSGAPFEALTSTLPGPLLRWLIRQEMAGSWVSNHPVRGHESQLARIAKSAEDTLDAQDAMRSAMQILGPQTPRARVLKQAKFLRKKGKDKGRAGVPRLQRHLASPKGLKRAQRSLEQAQASLRAWDCVLSRVAAMAEARLGASAAPPRREELAATAAAQRQQHLE